MNTPRVPMVACPTCKQPSRFAPDNAWRPFCSERCRQIDLGAWASESFRVPAQGAPDGEPEDVWPNDPPAPPDGRH